MTKRRLLLAAILPAVVALVVALTTGGGPGPGPDTRSAAPSGLLAGGTEGVPPGFTLPADTPPQVTTAITYAMAQLGKTYSETLDGGVGPDHYDCSGLVQQAYAAAGIALPRTTYTQYEAGRPVTGLGHIEAGDLIFIPGSDPGAGGAPGHVAMSIGSGLIIQAPFTGERVQINPLTSISRQITTVRRIVGPGSVRRMAATPPSRRLQQVLALQRIGGDAAAIHQFSEQTAGPRTCPTERYAATVPDGLTGARLTAAMVASVFASVDGNCPLALTVYRPGQVRATPRTPQPGGWSAGTVRAGAAPVGELTLSTAPGGAENLDRLSARFATLTWSVTFAAAVFPGKAPAPGLPGFDLPGYGLSAAGLS